MSKLGSAVDLEDLTTLIGELAEMADLLAARGDAPDAARETEELLCMVRQWQNRAEVRIRRLADVWRAMVRLDDDPHSTERQVALKQALAAHRGGDAP